MGVDKQAEEKIVEVVKDAKAKNPGLVKWIVGIIAAAIMAAIGFFGGIFGLTAKQQDSIKQLVIGSAVYQEAIAEPAVKADAKAEVKKVEAKAETKKADVKAEAKAAVKKADEKAEAAPAKAEAKK